jgi:phage antirepressor YoqD-like protein
MSNTTAVIRHEEVNVCGSNVLATVTQDNKCYFSPRHVCQALGIDWKTQYIKIMADQVLATTVVEIPTMRPDGSQIKAFMLPIEFLSGWLFTIKKVAPSIQAKLNLFRAEGFRALDAWFRQGLRSDQAVTGSPKYAVPQTMIEAMELALAQLRENEKLKEENAVMAPKARVYDAVVADKMMKVHEFARSLRGVNTVQTKWDLMRAGYLHRAWGTYRVRAQYRDKLFVEKLDSTGTAHIYVTDEGKKAMTKLYNEGRLTMKAGF